MLALRLRPLRIVPRQPRDRTADRAANPIMNALAQIINLARSLLALTLLVLLNALLLQALGANEAADSFFCGADVLVPRACGAVRVVLCDAARARDGVGAGFGGGVGEVVFGVSGYFAIFALGLG